MLQTGMSRVRVPMRSLIFFSLPNPSSRTMTLVFTQPLTEMSTRRSFWGVKCGCVGLTTLPPSTSRLSRKCEILDISQAYRHPRPVIETALLPPFSSFLLCYSTFPTFCQLTPESFTSRHEAVTIALRMVSRGLFRNYPLFIDYPMSFLHAALQGPVE
jgi:hypothetical protein